MLGLLFLLVKKNIDLICFSIYTICLCIGRYNANTDILSIMLNKIIGVLFLLILATLKIRERVMPL